MHSIDRDGLDKLLAALQKKGYQTIGPRLDSGAIVYEEVRSTEDFPIGYADRQDGGSYRLTKEDHPSLFGYVVGPDSWKKFLFPAELRLLSVTRKNGSMAITDETQSVVTKKRAFIGVRPCELAAIGVQDSVFLSGAYRDPSYESHRLGIFLVAVNCTSVGGTCFCASMQSGPVADSGYDLCLTEVLDRAHHFFLVDALTERGEDILEEIQARDATEAEIGLGRARIEQAKSSFTRTLEIDGLPQFLKSGIDHPRWRDVARRCLTCGNCTQVCPTCFCSTVEDVTDLAGSTAYRTRKWDSCFTLEFSYIHGGSVRTSARSRYRQWLMHKLGNWIDQFGMMGCVGCGRCITWCPVGIDITEEAGALRQQQPVSPSPSGE
jgi:ferredoxin